MSQIAPAAREQAVLTSWLMSMARTLCDGLRFQRALAYATALMVLKVRRSIDGGA